MSTCLFLDLETLDTDPTAIVDEMAAIVFSLSPDAHISVLAELDLRLCIPSQLLLGRTWSAETLQHRFGNKTMPTHFTGISPESAISQLFLMIERYTPDEIWIWGKDFDHPILKSLAKDCHRSFPRHAYRRVRCARDEFDGAFEGTDKKPRKKTHIALEDCRASMLDLQDALQARPRSRAA